MNSSLFKNDHKAFLILFISIFLLCTCNDAVETGYHFKYLPKDSENYAIPSSFKRDLLAYPEPEINHNYEVELNSVSPDVLIGFSVESWKNGIKEVQLGGYVSGSEEGANKITRNGKSVIYQYSTFDSLQVEQPIIELRNYLGGGELMSYSCKDIKIESPHDGKYKIAKQFEIRDSSILCLPVLAYSSSSSIKDLTSDINELSFDEFVKDYVKGQDGFILSLIKH